MINPAETVTAHQAVASNQKQMSPPPALSPLSRNDKRPRLPRYADGFRARSQFPSLTVPTLLEEAAEKFPRRTALIYFGSRISYAQLLEHVNRCAAGLQALGLRKGDRLGLMMPNCPQFVIAYFGGLQAGAIVTATSSMYTRREAAHQWHDAGVSGLIADRRLYPTAQAACAEVPEIRHVVLTGLREYQPSNFAALDRSLRSRAISARRKSSARSAPPSPF